MGEPGEECERKGEEGRRQIVSGVCRKARAGARTRHRKDAALGLSSRALPLVTGQWRRSPAGMKRRREWILGRL